MAAAVAALSRMSSAFAVSRAVMQPSCTPKHRALGFFGSSSMQTQECRMGKLGSARNGNGFAVAVRRVAVQPAQKGLVVEAKKEKKQKLRSHSAAGKRFRVTGGGLVVRRKNGKQHLNERKSRLRLNRLGKMALVNKRDLRNVKEALPYLAYR